MTLGDSAARGAKVALIGQAIKFAIQMTGIMVLARLLSPAEFGLVGMVAAIIGVAAIVADLGFSTAAIQAASISHYQRSNLFWINAGVGLAGGSALALSAGLIASFYGYTQIQPIVWALSAAFFIQSLTPQFTADAARNLRFGLLAIADVLAQFVAVSLAILMAIAGFGVWALVAQTALVPVATLVCLAASSRWVPSFPRRVPMKSLVHFGVNTFAVQVLNYLSSSIDSVLIGRFLGATQLGYYDRAFQLFKVPIQQAMGPLTRVMLPLLSRHQKDLGVLGQYLRNAQLVLMYGVVSVLVFVSAAGTPIVTTILGRDWLPAAQILPIFAVGGVFQVLGYVYYWAFLATGQTSIQLRYAFFTRLLMIALLIGGVQFGLHGVAIAVSLGLAMNWVVLSAIAVPKIGIRVRPLLQATMRPLVTHVAMFGAVSITAIGFTPLVGDGVLLLLLLVLVAAIFYGGMYVLFRSVRGDIRTVYAFVRRAI
ncbi:lipopolysaccharide biosynthesis protein [Okibacterium endophyticum]